MKLTTSAPVKCPSIALTTVSGMGNSGGASYGTEAFWSTIAIVSEMVEASVSVPLVSRPPSEEYGVPWLIGGISVSEYHRSQSVSRLINMTRMGRTDQQVLRK